MSGKIQVYLRLNRDIHEIAKKCAESVGIPLNAWMAERIAQGIRNWEDPVTGEKMQEALPKKKEADKWKG